MPTLETERLILRDFTMADWDALNALLSDPEVVRFMHFVRWDEAQRRAWLAQIVEEAQDPRRESYNWAIHLHADGALIGWFGIGESDHTIGTYEREYGYALKREFWGQGYMPEATRAIIGYEFTTLRTRRIIAECDTRNAASARVMQKCGMTYQGTSNDADGTSSHHYAISASEASQPDR